MFPENGVSNFKGFYCECLLRRVRGRANVDNIDGGTAQKYETGPVAGGLGVIN